MSTYLNSCKVTPVAQITCAIPSSTCAHIAQLLDITFLLRALSSLHLMGFESSLINFTCPHFCPQLFIGPYYENLNLLFDYWLLPWRPVGFDALLSSPEAINDCCKQVLRLWYSECPIIWPNLFPLISQFALYPQRDLESNWVTVWGKKLRTNFAALHCSDSVWLHSQKVCVIGLWKH